MQETKVSMTFGSDYEGTLTTSRGEYPIADSRDGLKPYDMVLGALGFLLAIVLMAGVRERLETAKIAVPLKGFPISLVIAGLMSLAFHGFSNMFAGVM